MYAIINISGKQFKVVSGARFRVPKQNGETGSSINFDQVLLIKNGESTQIGNPTLKGASVTGKIVDHGRYRKILVYKKKDEKGIKEKMVIGNGLRRLSLIKLILQKFNTTTKNNFERNCIFRGGIIYGTQKRSGKLQKWSRFES